MLPYQEGRDELEFLEVSIADDLEEVVLKHSGHFECFGMVIPGEDTPVVSYLVVSISAPGITQLCFGESPAFP